jgi:hypothetical protein
LGPGVDFDFIGAFLPLDFLIASPLQRITHIVALLTDYL